MIHKRKIVIAGLLLASIALPSTVYAATAKKVPTVAAGAVVVGASPAPPSGPGPGTLTVWQPGDATVHQVPFAPAGTMTGSSFYVAADQATHSIFVPTEAGVTKVVSTRSWRVEGSFTSPAGSRVAKVTANGRLVLVESASQTVGYQTTSPYRAVFTASVGGNALVIAPNGKDAFVGGNADTVVTELALPSGKVVRSFAVHRSGDMAWAAGQIFSADIASGVMTIIRPDSGQIIRIATPEVDPTFNYSSIAMATSGFMQLAVSPGQHRVYAAGFSGHILVFSTRLDTYLGEVKITANPGTANQLSGLAVLPGGRQAVVTVENLSRTLVVSLRTGKVVSSQIDLPSNRWVLVSGS